MFFGALLSAILSTASGALLAPTALFTENVLKRLYPHMGDRQFLLTLRLVLVIFTLAVVTFALTSDHVRCLLFEVETENHIVITWAEDGDAASAVVGDAYPQEHVLRLTKRPRDTWVISKSALGIAGKMDPCHTARDCLSKAEGDKVHAIRLYMHETGSDLEQARKAIESNMVMGW